MKPSLTIAPCCSNYSLSFAAGLSIDAARCGNEVTSALSLLHALLDQKVPCIRAGSSTTIVEFLAPLGLQWSSKSVGATGWTWRSVLMAWGRDAAERTSSNADLRTTQDKGERLKMAVSQPNQAHGYSYCRFTGARNCSFRTAKAFGKLAPRQWLFSSRAFNLSM